MTVQMLTTSDLMNMSQAELDELYKNSPVGEIPNGDSQGTALFVPEWALTKELSPIITSLVWKGKVFDRDREFLLNKVGPFSFNLVKAQVYRGKSWFCDGEAIILDYSQTSFLAQALRDEIREVAPGLYLGNAYLGRIRVLNFILEL